jgi:hypothetical protein
MSTKTKQKYRDVGGGEITTPSWHSSMKLQRCLIKHHAMKTHGGKGVIAPCILNHSTDVEMSGKLHAQDALPPAPTGQKAESATKSVWTM